MATVNISQVNVNATYDPTTIETYIITFTAILVLTALIAMLVNVIVFSSVYWIRRPMPPILKMSISLAAADSLSTSIFAFSIITSYLTYHTETRLNISKLLILSEMAKLCGILITVTHLLALSLNHYIGILKPMHYNSIVTRRKVTTVTILLWCFPTLFVFCLVMLQADLNYWLEYFRSNDEQLANHITFIDTFRFRMSYSSFMIISVLIMAACYTHILVIVRRHQTVWKKLSRIGSSKWSGKTSSMTNSREQRQLEGNIRAIYTTLLILGSCVIGWLPAILIFVLMCRKDCYVNGEELDRLSQNYMVEFMCLRVFENMLVLLKMLVNPIIYSIRMKEIQESTKHMKLAIIGIFCPHHRPDLRDYRLATHRRRCSPNAHSNSSLRVSRMTVSIKAPERGIGRPPSPEHKAKASLVGITGRTEIVNTLL